MNNWLIIILLLFCGCGGKDKDSCCERKMISHKMNHRKEDDDCGCKVRKVKRVDDEMCPCEDSSILDEDL